MRLSLPTTLLLAGTTALTPVDARHYYGGSHLLSPSRHRVPNSHSFNSLAIANPVQLALDFMRTPIYSDTSNIIDMAEAAIDRLTSSSSMSNPRYSVTENKDTGTIELAMELPGVASKNLTVEVEDNNLLRIHGSRTFGETMKSEFDHSFTLDKDIDPSSLKVTLSAGILKVIGTKKEKTVHRLTVASFEDDSEPELPLTNQKKENENMATQKNVSTTSTEETTEGLTIMEDA